MACKLTEEEVLKRFKKIHGGKYSYNKVKYKNTLTKVIITCSKHGDFMQTPFHHYSGHGCFKCSLITKSENATYSLEQVKNKINEVFGEGVYDLSTINYKTAKDKVELRCLKEGHGTFLKSFSHLREGRGCPLCSKISRHLKTKVSNKNVYVYIIEFDKFIKIGISSRLGSRIRKLRYEVGEPTKNIYIKESNSIEESFILENMLLNLFYSYHDMSVLSNVGGKHEFRDKNNLEEVLKKYEFRKK